VFVGLRGRRREHLRGYMTFYSPGSALGATATATVFASAGWTGSGILITPDLAPAGSGIPTAPASPCLGCGTSLPY